VSNAQSIQPSIVPAPADINALIGNNVSDLVQGTILAQPTPEPPTPLAKPDVISDCNDMGLNPNVNLDIQSLHNNLGSPSPADNILPANPSSTSLPLNISPPNQAPPATGSLSLLDQLTPESFTLGTEIKEKKRITKADFFKSDCGITADTNTNDPFADLNPLWGLKKQ